MDTEVLDPPSTTEVTLTQTAIAPLERIRSGLASLADRYRGAEFELTTTKGLDAAKAARNELREQGRYAVQRATAEFKRQANDAKRAVDELAESLIAITGPIEDRIDAQIKAREKDIADEKAAKARAEQERKEKNEASIAVIGKYLDHARGMSSARIQAGIDVLTELDLSATMDADYIDRAKATREATLTAMRTLHAQTLMAEQEREIAEKFRAALQAEAAELQAKREAMRKQDEALAAERAEIERQRAEIAAQRADIERQRAEQNTQAEEKAGTPAESGPGEPATAGMSASNVGGADPAPSGDEGTTATAQQPAVEPASAPANVAPGAMLPPEINLGEINARLGFNVTRAFLAALGINGRQARMSVAYPESDWPCICDALINHLQQLKGAA